jgi:hypothetical protein
MPVLEISGETPHGGHGGSVFPFFQYLILGSATIGSRKHSLPPGFKPASTMTWHVTGGDM